MPQLLFLLIAVSAVPALENSAAEASENHLSQWVPELKISELGIYVDSARGIDFVDLGRCFSFAGKLFAAQFALRFTSSSPSDHIEAGQDLGIRLHIYKRQKSKRAFLLVAESGVLIAREETYALPSGHVIVNASGDSLPLSFEVDDCLGWSYTSAHADVVIAYSDAASSDVRWHRPALDRSEDALRQFPGVAQRHYDVSIYVISQSSQSSAESQETAFAASSSSETLGANVSAYSHQDSTRLEREEAVSHDEAVNYKATLNATSDLNTSPHSLIAYKRLRNGSPRIHHHDGVTPDAKCRASEHGITWLHVRSLLLQHLGISKGRMPSEADAIAAQRAIIADEYLPMSAIASVQAGELEASCRLGSAALMLLGCIANTGSFNCRSSNADRIIHFILGLSLDGPKIDDVVLSGWPVHALLAILVRKANEGVLLDDGYSTELQQSLQLMASARLSRTAIASRGIPPPLMAALSHVGPCMAPFNRLTCDSSKSDEAHWAAASTAVALAHAQLESNREHAAEMASSACDGNQNACLNAVFDEKVSSHLRDAEDAFETPLASPSRDAAVDKIAGTSWPLLIQLSELSATVSPLWGIEEGTASPYFNHSWGICGCSLIGWHANDIHALAASLRILRRLSTIGNNSHAIIMEMRSSDARMACPAVFETQEQNATGNGSCRRPASIELAISVLKAWGDPSSIAEGLRDASPSEFDAGLCVPGALAAAMVDDHPLRSGRFMLRLFLIAFGDYRFIGCALRMVCALVALIRNCYGLADELVEVTRTHLPGIVPCMSPAPTRSDTSAYQWNKHSEFQEAWADLIPWVQPVEHFVADVWEPVLISNRWWLGAETTHGKSPVLIDMPMSSSACSGIIGSGPGHHCHAGLRGAGPGVGVVRSKVAVPWTKVLGVGPMKAGSTAVWQSLGAATQLPMGHDCLLSGHTDLVWRIARRQVPLWDLLQGCSEEEFKWDLVKDPMLTPIAGRLAASWPALSVHGEALRLYFLVRNPFDCVRAFVAHLDLQLNPSDGLQHFSLGNMPNPRRFTRGKQLFLDVRRDNLEYSGYIDAAVQRWVLAVDEYLSCPHRFALIRYEDFVIDPVQTIHLLVQQLGLGSRWSGASAERVREAASTQYQPRSSSRGSDPRTVFGPTLHARIYAAVEARAFLLGYGSLLGPRPAEALTSPPIDVPTVPTEQSCHRI